MFRCSLLFAVIVFNCVSVDAGIIVNVQDTSIAAGGFGYVDVRISSDSNDVLSSFGYAFQITGSNLNGDLTFRPDWDFLDPVNPANQSNSEQHALDYVLGTDTDPGVFSASRLSPTLLIGGDVAFSGVDTSPLSGNHLLARLELQHLTPNAAWAVGSTFQISLVADPTFTSFYDNDGLFAMPDPIPLSYTSTPGTITITSAPVPEPGSFWSLMAGGISLILARMRGRVEAKKAVD